MKVGDYVYIKTDRKYGIAEIYEFVENNNILISNKNTNKTVSIGNVISSPKSIDLIQVGDYVNGELIIEIIRDGRMSRVKSIDETYFDNDIKNIVTKEQFEREMYIINE